MGVFTKYQTSKTMTHGQGYNLECSMGHEIDGVIPQINPSIMQIQNQHLIGKPCSCKRLLYFEQECGCPFDKHWEIKWEPNPNG